MLRNALNDQAPSAMPLHQHGAFDDASVSLDFIDRAKDALLCIGDLLQPNMAAGDEDLHHVKRSQVAALFAFFGQALAEPIETANEANHRLWLEAKKISP